MNVAPLVLQLPKGRVCLEPLGPQHAAGIVAAAPPEETWRLMPAPRPTTVAAAQEIIDKALAGQKAGTDLPFAVIDRLSGTLAGSTRYLDIQPGNRNLEIGWTWYAEAFQRTSINTECKLLLMTHAFETLGCVRVQLKTDGRNTRSQAAITRLGAVREGTLRKTRVCHDGYIRDTVYFSVLDSEWPAVKARLEGLLAKAR
ncbi:MAG: GNAT family N-acetyltransferase [Phycisphaerales bacterium]